MHGIREAHVRSRFYARRPGALLTTAAALAGLTGSMLLTAPSAQAAPPTPPSAAQARTMLAGLTVAPETSMDGYSRDLFPHWINQGDNCNTREVVLKRDGSNVQTDDQCRSVSGSWFSQFDGVTLTSASNVDIDHMVPLAEAWRSGGRTWSAAKRQSFANNLTAAQLIAVSASSNRSKGDKDPANWMPRAAYHCTYARSWVWVKNNYAMTVDSAEKAALTSTLAGC
ncbi:HNH endonuclease family protein [Streptomyces sp. 549]|uniref:HNH endonuclease family protein n=1 Tax=Streptomyces sp. 549 TaxID=3049076 RepID=UPI0024C44F00|nr:HNH endonuclease family protein [Streptomyces sp. 549]MDK1473993.1 HNH endonuclease family protein [Streptomyces sp. 549]